MHPADQALTRVGMYASRALPIRIRTLMDLRGPAALAMQVITKAVIHVWQKHVPVPMVILPRVLRARQMVLPSVLLATQGISKMEMTASLALLPHINLSTLSQDHPALRTPPAKNLMLSHKLGLTLKIAHADQNSAPATVVHQPAGANVRMMAKSNAHCVTAVTG